MILNPEAVGDPNQTPVVYLGPGAAEVLGIRERTTPTIAERVAAGAKWLDENRPGWVDRIDLDTLDLGDPCRCVLGQEYGDFFESDALAARWDDDQDMAGDRGFDGLYSVSGAAIGSQYAALTLAWRDYIQSRRDAVLAGLVGKELDE